MRRDALERREALIRAAADCFSEFGFSVPLDDIADRAGVGRGTLYRNFRDRMELALVIFEREVELLEPELHHSLSLEALIDLIVRRGLKTRMLFVRLSAEMPLDDANVAFFQLLYDRVVAMLRPFVERARAQGQIRPDVTAEQIMLATRMISGLLESPLSQRDADTVIAGGLDLILRGVQP